MKFSTVSALVFVCLLFDFLLYFPFSFLFVLVCGVFFFLYLFASFIKKMVIFLLFSSSIFFFFLGGGGGFLLLSVLVYFFVFSAFGACFSLGALGFFLLCFVFKPHLQADL